MAVVDLGKLRFDYKGDFSENVNYEARDIVRYQGDIYYFNTDHAAGSWNASEADVMLTGIDVISTQGDLITGDASGNNTRLAVDYNFAGDSGSTRAGSKLLASTSSVPLPTSVTKYLTVSNGGLYFDGTATTSTTYAVTVAQDAGTNKFHLDGVVAPAITLTRGHTYIFDVSDASNSGHPLRFKVDGAGGASYTLGVTTSGTEGTANASVTFVVPGSAPDALRYYCTVHGDAMGNALTIQGGASLTTSYTPNEYDTAIFDTADSSFTGHIGILSTLANGIHGGQDNTHVSSVTDNNGNTYLQVTSVNLDNTNGGQPVTTQRALYSYVNDSGFTPTYTGTSYPYVHVIGTLSKDASVTATITQNTLSDGKEILLVNGRPAYQHTSDTFATVSGLVGGSWLAFDNSGATTSTAFGTASSFSHSYTTGVTYNGTQGTANSNITWVIPTSAPTVYLYDQTETNPFGAATIDPVAHPQTANLAYVHNGARVLQHVHVRENNLMQCNDGSRLASNVWNDISRYYENNNNWVSGDRLRPQLTCLSSTGEASGFMHWINIHVGWDPGSYHQGGRVVRRYSSDGGSTWSAWEQVMENRNPYSNGARTDVDFGSYVYTTNAATYSYQGEQVQFSFLDRQIVSGNVYEYKLQFKGLNSTPLIYLNWHSSYNNQAYSRTGNSEWNVQEVLL
ncbi:MAG: hypothetical protein CMK23_05325 [Porticoccaceae bacterium]|nr:hypothetical protein [Porticoccaceae bacterium]|tara:strand:- start:7323 stop:9359 length:2037 start_codon:yes stop_codon:yes gene_type:complete